MEQVLEYTLVTAEGELVTVTEEGVTGLVEGDPRLEVDILMGLRGAGGQLLLQSPKSVPYYSSCYLRLLFYSIVC